MDGNAVKFLVALAIALAWYAAGYVFGRRARKDPPWSLCAECAKRTRGVAARVPQLFMEVWGADGVMRAKWPVTTAGAPAGVDLRSVNLDDDDTRDLWAEDVRQTVGQRYRNMAGAL